jgi:hypothetical protein
MNYFPYIAGGTAPGDAAVIGQQGRRAVRPRRAPDTLRRPLFHWTTEAAWEHIQATGWMQPQVGIRAVGYDTPRLYWSADPLKWHSPRHKVLLRTSADAISCVTTGSKWADWASAERGESYLKLDDCYATEPISLAHIALVGILR